MGCAALLRRRKSAEKNGQSYTYAEGSPQYWRGLHSRSLGTVFRRDPHIWVVSPELAKKAGLPLEWASDELQGVAAAAYRMQPSGDEDCGWGGNLAACKPIMQCTLDLYFDRQTQKLPWAPSRPVADFDWQDVSSAWHMLPALGAAPEANGDRSRSTQKSPNYPSLGARSPFADPKTGEELVWAPEGGPTGMNGTRSVLAYDREMHGRYAYVRLDDSCGRTPGRYTNGQILHLMALTEQRTIKGVHHQIHLPVSWVNRVREFAKSYEKQDFEFNQNIWKQINSGDSK